MPNKTTNYQLNQWEPEDNFLRTDFNEDNAKIEAALTEMARGSVKIITGTYSGTGTTAQTIEFGQEVGPVFVQAVGVGSSTNYSGYVLASGHQYGYSSTAIGLYHNGTSITIQFNNLNNASYTYRYIALIL